MGKIVVNKHYDNKDIVTRERFHEDIELAKGEIIITNTETPSIYVLNNDGIPKQIAGGGTGSVSDEQLEEIKEQISSAYTEADNVLKNEIISGYTDADVVLKNEIISGYTEADSVLRKELIGANDDFKKDVNDTLLMFQSAYQEADTYIISGYTAAVDAVDARTINGKALSTNPVLNAKDINVAADYLSLVIGTPENVISNDTLQMAIKKVENMVMANALAFSAAVNNLNSRIDELTKIVEKYHPQEENTTPEEGE